MPRHQNLVMINGQGGVGWFMDFELEEQQHLGTLENNKNLLPGE